MTPLPPSAPPGPEAALRPDPGPGEVPAAAAAPPPALPEFTEPPFHQAPTPAMETSCQHPQDSTSARTRRLYPPLPVHTDGKGECHSHPNPVEFPFLSTVNFCAINIFPFPF